MGMTNEEREKHIRVASVLIGAINDLIRPILMYQIEKDVTREALENYIKMLEQQPSENCISREEAKNLFLDGTEGYDFRSFTRMEIGEMLDELSPVTPSRPKGKWIEHPHECGSNWEYPKYECSKCHVWVEDDSDFCPCCGVDMRGDTE